MCILVVLGWSDNLEVSLIKEELLDPSSLAQLQAPKGIKFLNFLLEA